MHDNFICQAVFNAPSIGQKARAHAIGFAAQTQIKAGGLDLQGLKPPFGPDGTFSNDVVDLVICENSGLKTHFGVRLVCTIGNPTFTLTKADASLYARALV